MKKNTPFIVEKDLSNYKGPLTLFTHTVLVCSLRDITYVGLGRRGLGVRAALRKRGLMNMRVLTEKDPNKSAEARREAAAYHKETKEQQSQLLNHQPLFGSSKEGVGTILRAEGKYVKLEVDGDSLKISIKVCQQFSGQTQVPETWLVAQCAGRSYDIVARPGVPILVGEIKEDGTSSFGDIVVDTLYKKPEKETPFNPPRAAR